MRIRRPQLRDLASVEPEVIQGLQAFLLPSGCFRVYDPELRVSKGRSYKKGFEARFVARTEDEIEVLVGLIRRAGLVNGKPFAKAKQFIVPVYGRKQVEWLLELMQMNPE